MSKNILRCLLDICVFRCVVWDVGGWCKVSWCSVELRFSWLKVWLHWWIWWCWSGWFYQGPGLSRMDDLHIRESSQETRIQKKKSLFKKFSRTKDQRQQPEDCGENGSRICNCQCHRNSHFDFSPTYFNLYTTVLKIPIRWDDLEYLKSFPYLNLIPSSGDIIFDGSHNDLILDIVARYRNDENTSTIYARLSPFCCHRSEKDYRIWGEAISTYPKLCHNLASGPEHIIADGWLELSLKNRIYFGIADGIGHGFESQKAAMCGLLGFLANLIDFQGIKGHGEMEKHHPVYNVPQAMKRIIESYKAAQDVVVANTREMTALAGGVIVQIDPAEDAISPDSVISSKHAKYSWKWALVAASLGDCKIYRFCRDTEQIIEITSDDSSKISVRDAGGHLGLECVWDNLTGYFCPLDEGDFIICMTDGVHDNLDPETLRISPLKLGLNSESWKDVSPEEALAVRRKFRETRISQILGLQMMSAYEPKTYSPFEITSRILDYVQRSTEMLRSAEEKGAILQRDWDKMNPDERIVLKNEIIRLQRESPGKYDHSTCMTILVENSKQISAKPSSWKHPQIPLLASKHRSVYGNFISRSTANSETNSQVLFRDSLTDQIQKETLKLNSPTNSDPPPTLIASPWRRRINYLPQFSSCA